MDKNTIQPDDSSWQAFLKAKMDGEVRNSNMSNFISKSNVFQNDTSFDVDRQKANLSQLDIKSGNGASEPENKVQFRSEPLRPKQTNQERDMFLIAKPLVQEYTTLNIVKQPTIQANNHKISIDIHNNLQKMIKKSEDLMLQKRNQTIVPKQGQTQYKKVINEQFLDLIRKTDQAFSPMKYNNNPNPYSTEVNSNMKLNKDMKQEDTIQRNKYDREFTFKSYHKQDRDRRDQLGDIQLPQNIEEIMGMKKRHDRGQLQNENQFQFQVMPDDEFIYMEDLLEQSNFERKFKDQTIESNKQQLKVKNNQDHSRGIFNSTAAHQESDIDINNLDFNSILQITSGQLPKGYSSQSSQKDRSSDHGFTKSATISQSHLLQQVGRFEGEASRSEQFKKFIMEEPEEEDEDDSDDDIYFKNKCVGTTPRKDMIGKQDESVQISSLRIDEDVRNIPRVGAILLQIQNIKKQYSMAAERLDRAKLKTLLNHRLVDLINLIMLNESCKMENLGDAVQYLLSMNKKHLQDQHVDGISKLELLYLFLTEYKAYKIMTENELDQTYTVTNQKGNLMLVTKSTEKKKKKKEEFKTNKKDFNDHGTHFRVSQPPQQTESSIMPRYMQTTHSTTQKNNTYSSKKSEHLVKLNPLEGGNWISKTYTQMDDMNQKFGWTKVN